MITLNPDTTMSTLTRTQLPNVYKYAKFGWLVMLSLLIVIGNIMTIVAVARTRKLRRLPTNTLLINLAVADVLVGALLIVFVVLSLFVKTEHALRLTVCLARSPYYTTICVSTNTLLAIAVDRYLAIVHPLSYRRRVTIPRARVVSILIWLCQLIIVGGTSCFYGIVVPYERIASGSVKDLIPDIAFNFVILPQVYIPVAGNVILYLCIFISIRKRKRVSDNVLKPDGSTTSPKDDKMATAVTKMMCIVLGYLIIAWVPYFSLVSLYSYEESKPFWFVYAEDVATFLVYSNSAVNPIIYSWFHRDFKEAYSRLLKCQITHSAA